MKKLKWMWGVILVAGLVALIYVVNSTHDRPETSHNVGVFQVVRHPALDAMADSFQQSLESRFPGKVTFDVKIPEGDAAKTEQMAQTFASGEYDLVFVIGTNLAQSLAEKTKTTPIVLGGATDPAAAGLIESWEKPGNNVTGTSDLSPVAAQLDSLRELLSDGERVGIIHNPSEDNSKIILGHFKQHCESKNLVPVSVSVSNPNDIQATLVSLVGKIDALYAPTDATVQSAFPALIKVAEELKLPVFNCDEGTVRQGAVFSIGFDYSDLGTTSAEMAADILEGKQKPAEMPIRLVGKSALYFNPKRIESLGLTVPDHWRQEGTEVTE